MDDMNAFEQRLAGELEHLAGPRRAVDARAIRQAAQSAAGVQPWSTLTRRLRGGTSLRTEGGFSMFAAAKLIAAVTIIALFGGFLLSGALTPQPDPEPAPAAMTASPTPGASRLEVPEASMAVAFPEGWTIRVEPFTPALEPAGWFNLAAIVYAESADPGQSCQLSAYVEPEDPSARYGERVSLDAEVADRLYVADDYVDEGGGAMSWPLQGWEWDTVRLPAGDAARIDYVGRGDKRGSQWLVTDGSDLYQLICESEDAPDDHWRSIAETLQFLPAREQIGAEPPAPAVTTGQRVSGFITEEVEPGVERIVNDSVRDLTDTAAGRLAYVRISREGDPWLFGEDAFFRLGDRGMHLPPKDSGNDSIEDVEIAPDGTLWLAALDYGWLSDKDSEAGKLERHTSGALYAFDGRAWSETAMPLTISGEPRDLEIMADGTVWAAWNADGLTLTGFDGEHWEVVEAPGCSLFPMRASDTDIYVDGGPGGLTDCDGTLYRFDGTDWQAVETPEGYLSRGGIYGSAPVGTDGTLWVELRRESEASDRRTGIARFDGTSWEEWGIDDFPDEGVENPISGYFNFEAIAPDGSLWGTTDECDGVAHLEGTTVTRYLIGHCIVSTDMAPDGSLWLVTVDHGGDVNDTYVIRAETGSATE